MGHVAGYNEGHKELLEFQAASAAVITERLQENAKIEAQRQADLEESRKRYASANAAWTAKYDRLRASNGTGSNPMSQTPGREPGALDAAAQGDGLPRCVEESKRSEFIDLLEEAERTAAKLIECQKNH